MARVGQRPRRRAGFTLLEVLLAMAITIVLMGGLYYAIDAQLREMEEGRNAIEQSSLARVLLARIANDLAASVGPTQPAVSSSSTPTTSGGGSGTTTVTTSAATTPAVVVFQLGVKGDADRVAIFQTRLSRAIINPPADTSGNTPPPVADVRRIGYFIAPQGGGLARQEIQQATADAVDELPTDIDETNTRILAPEVETVSFRYYDGSSWLDTWDGSTPGPDGATPQGPPRAVEITIGLKQGGVLKTFKHVIAFPTAPGPSSQS